VESLRSRFEILRREDARRLRAVVEYANDTGCRSVALRRYFGDEDTTRAALVTSAARAAWPPPSAFPDGVAATAATCATAARGGGRGRTPPRAPRVAAPA